MAAAKSYKRDGQGARNVHLLRRAPSLVQHIGALGDSGLRPSAEYPAQPILSNCIQLQQTRLTQIDLRAKLQGPRTGRPNCQEPTINLGQSP
ncbi:hypothetical protein E5Q_04721 [Mixia osmundae IAM 14324]|uniref:Uncharacterized protein n=1 Tax=Mixia osmundae (strain CBS 9802 / IAM 14324 / JCM 22182 / KY 12970) TaxID=764103 RepID=G7E5D1_MIXOS|nr:hypothetical protein E5Q_04721 [Mixia osmundae IAM 14324]